MPQACACSAPIFSPSSAQALARAGPISRGRKKLTPQSGISPMRLNASTKLALRAATTMSQASARPTPMPAATPLTAHTTGIGEW